MSERYLLDTSAISILAMDRPELVQTFRDWIAAKQDELYVSVVTIMEIEQGIRTLSRRGASRKAANLAAWLSNLEDAMDENVLDVTKEIAKSAGQLADRTEAEGWHPGYPDVLIGATAIVHDFSVLTHNVRHFEAMKVPCFDPIASLPV